MKTKIFLAFPTTGIIKTKTFFSVMCMVKYASFDWMIGTKESSILHYNREHLVQQAIENKCTHILFIDSDMRFEVDAAERLLARDKDIIGAPYNARQLPLTGTVNVTLDNGTVVAEQYGELLKVAGVPMGFTLIKTSVFEKLSQPWFFWESNDKGEVIHGEDSWFCRKAREAGFDIWCDMSIPIKHIGDYLY